MFKTLFFILLLLPPTTSGWASVQLRWFSVTSLLIQDEQTKILFDAAFTRPGLQHWLNLSKFHSDEELVKTVLKENGSEEIDALFCSHSHFDHVVDLPSVAKLTGATFYVDENSEKIARAYGENLSLSRISNYQKIKLGAFIVTPIRRTHAKIWQLFEYLPGKVPDSFSFDFYDYRVGDSWLYLIEHPTGNILLDGSPDSSRELLKARFPQIKVLIQGVNNRESDDVLLEGYLKTFDPEVFVPTHFDNFLLGILEGWDTPGVGVDPLIEKIKARRPGLQVLKPVRGKKVDLF